MPSPWSEHNSPSTDSSRITTVGKRLRLSACRATACMLISCGRDKEERTAGQGRMAQARGGEATRSCSRRCSPGASDSPTQ
ncbi:hypothetical protein Q5P01_001990 [Channa striata]|uniref:Uncharacterized protein n=1 Tax=Channa striata TaxID=64152 RepID=A0AA88T4E6_CHASR|nr:hypothetical protein Q5P01_001990 [Channa striata]